MATNLEADVLIVGGGLGGCAAASAVTALGYRALMTEEWPEIGGQLVTQAVPPDEHPWIERFGCTRRYRRLRSGVRERFRSRTGITDAARNDPVLNPGNGWVSRLCAEPALWLDALRSLLGPALDDGHLRIGKPWRPTGAELGPSGRIEAIWFEVLELEEDVRVTAPMVLDATETGDLLPLVGASYRSGGDSRSDFGEAHAPEVGMTVDQQGLTWVQALGWDPTGDHTIARPADYEHWRAQVPPGWPGPQLSLTYPDVRTGAPTRLDVLGEGGLFAYRRVLDPAHFLDPEGVEAITLVNWPQNDFFADTFLDKEPGDREIVLERAQSLTLSLLYWLQTELGLVGLRPRPDIAGAPNGLAQAPYFREPRRLRAMTVLTEREVGVDMNPGRHRAEVRADSIGIGAYRIDLHQSPARATLDIAALPYQIPLGCLLAESPSNLIAAGKCLGVSHIANGCTRLHPVEWNVGESAGVLAASCLTAGVLPRDFLVANRLADLQRVLVEQGIELHWPDEVHPL